MYLKCEDICLNNIHPHSQTGKAFALAFLATLHQKNI